MKLRLNVTWILTVICLFISSCGNAVNNESQEQPARTEAGGYLESTGDVEDLKSFAEIEGFDDLAGEAIILGDWLEVEAVDEFGDETGNIHFATICKGTFDNTAASGSELAVVILYEQKKERFIFRLLEYGNHMATYTSHSNLTFKYKDDKVTFEASLIGDAPNGDLILEGDEYEKLSECLLEGKNIKAVIYIDDAKYSFEISCSGFDSIDAELKKRKEEIGIKGVYYQAPYNSKFSEYVEIIPRDKVSGTLIYHDDHSKGERGHDENGNASSEYTYNPETFELSTEKRLFFDNKLLVVDDKFMEIDLHLGSIPEADLFNETYTTDYNTYTFDTDGYWKTKDSDGVYYRDGSLLYLIYYNSVLKEYDSYAIFFIYNGNLYRGNYYVLGEQITDLRDILNQ